MAAPFLSLSSIEERLVVAQEMMVQVHQWECLFKQVLLHSNSMPPVLPMLSKQKHSEP